MSVAEIQSSHPQETRLRAVVETGWRKYYRRYFNLIWGSVSVVFFLVAWEIAALREIVDPFFVGSPSRIWEALGSYLGSREFVTDITFTSIEFIGGLALSIVFGVVLGVCIGWYRFAFALLYPILFAMYVVPHVAFLPLFIMWFGIGIPAKVMYVFFGGIFPILFNTAVAFNTIDPKLISAARSFRATDLQIFRTVAVPGSWPIILTGIRLSIGKCLTAVVIAEFWGAFAGIGNMISRSGSIYQVGKMFVGVLIVALMGIVLTELMHQIEDRFDAWRVSNHQ